MNQIYDFTFAIYKKFCEKLINSEYKIYTLKKYFDEKPVNKFIILRHDVDLNPSKALQMAKLENMYKIKSTYYFRFRKKIFDPETISLIYKMGHEIGYHYETLDKCNGNFSEAISLFKKELKIFRSFGYEIKTICAHGSPIKKNYSHNCDIFRHNPSLYTQSGIKGEAYLDVKSGIVYISDSGRKWWCFDYIPDLLYITIKKGRKNVGTPCNSIHQLSFQGENNYYILTHPQHWYKNKFEIVLSKSTHFGIKFIKSLLRRSHYEKI